MGIKWTLDNIKKYLLDNNSKLISSDEDYYNQLNNKIKPLKIKLDIKCFHCNEGIIYKRDIDHISNRNQNYCIECSKKILSEKMSNQNKEWWKNNDYKEKMSLKAKDQFTGEKNPNYKPELSDEEREIQRNTPENYNWRNEVFKRDNYACQCCRDNRGGNLTAHHLYNWSDKKDLRYNIDNGITLCDICHKKFHTIYGYNNNTKEQFNEFLKTYKRSEIKVYKDKNTTKVPQNTCNIIGVNWNKKEQKWVARICIYSKDIWLGGYKDISKAITLRLIAENQYWGNSSPQKYLFDLYNVYDYIDIEDFKSKNKSAAV